MKIIMIAGNQNSGKNYVASKLQKAYENEGKTVECLAYADPMKQIIATVFDISIPALNHYKDNTNEYYINTRKSEATEDYSLHITDFRQILQRFGSEAMKPIFGNQVWSDLLKAKIAQSEADIVLITDFRFDLEYSLMLETYEDLLTVLVKGGDKDSSHPSETIPEVPYTTIIHNEDKPPLDVHKVIKDLIW